jgi:pimeloyl-ACP methyl ester carboxylesterase
MPEFDWYLLDLPGHGRSDWLPRGLIYHFIDGVAHVCEFLTRYIPQPVGLVAHSMGAGMAPLVGVGSGIAAVQRLILVDGLGPLTSPAAEAPQLLRRALQLLGKENRPRLYADRSDVAEAIAASRALTLEQAEPLVARSVQEVEGGWVLRHDPRLKWTSRQRITEDQVAAFLEAVEQATLLVVPEQGLYRKFGWHEREPHLKDLHVAALAGGHHIHLEQPQAVADSIRHWWA